MPSLLIICYLNSYPVSIIRSTYRIRNWPRHHRPKEERLEFKTKDLLFSCITLLSEMVAMISREDLTHSRGSIDIYGVMNGHRIAKANYVKKSEEVERGLGSLVSWSDSFILQV